MRYETVDILFPIRVQKVGTDIDETYVILRMRERLVIDSSSQFIGCQTFHIVESSRRQASIGCRHSTHLMIFSSSSLCGGRSSNERVIVSAVKTAVPYKSE